MLETGKDAATRVAVRWRALGPSQKFVTGCLVAGAALTVLASVLIARHVSYSTLFTNLEADQASQVVEKLAEQKVAYRLTNGGRTIQVPEKDVYALRLKLAGESTPGGAGSGYEIFDRSRFGMTSFMQQMNYRRALEGELARTIREMDEVVMARVHLVTPERSVFADDTKLPSASVVLRLKPGVRLGPKQIAGIGALVAGSVEGLTPDRVNVLDCFGNLLSNNAQNPLLDAGSTARFEVEGEVGRGLEERAQSLLDRVVGPDMAVVRVSAELDFERLERESESYDPANAAIRSEQTTEQTTPESGGETSSAVTNYEINKTVERVKKAPGNVKRLTVAVTVDGHYEKTGDKTPPRFTTRPPAELDKLAALVKNAVGLDEHRGDQFQIACVQFDRSYVEETHSEMQREDRRILWQTIFNRGSIVLAAALVLLALRTLFGSMVRILGAPAGAPAPVAAAAGGNEAEASGPTLEPAAAGAGVELATAAPVRRNGVTNRVSEISRRRPEDAAALIMNMLEEDR